MLASSSLPSSISGHVGTGTLQARLCHSSEKPITSWLQNQLALSVDSILHQHPFSEVQRLTSIGAVLKDGKIPCLAQAPSLSWHIHTTLSAQKQLQVKTSGCFQALKFDVKKCMNSRLLSNKWGHGLLGFHVYHNLMTKDRGRIARGLSLIPDWVQEIVVSNNSLLFAGLILLGLDWTFRLVQWLHPTWVTGKFVSGDKSIITLEFKWKKASHALIRLATKCTSLSKDAPFSCDIEC